MLILDKLDDHIARITTEEGTLHVDRCLLRGNVQEGDVLRPEGNAFIRDEAATQARREHIRSLLKERLHLRR